MTYKWDLKNIPDQKGRVAIVTGANSGIGFETAKALALKKAMVVIASRNPQKGMDAVKTINAANPKIQPVFLQLDLGNLKSVEVFANTFKSRFKRLDLLINNAGVMMPPYSKTEDGFELQFGTNHLGHFALTGFLLELIKNTENSRIVTVSSMAHRWGKLDFNDLNWEKRDYKKIQPTVTAKLQIYYLRMSYSADLKRPEPM